MVKMMLLLLSAVALLVNPAVATPVRHKSGHFGILTNMFNLVETCNASLTEVQLVFVEDVKDLTEGSDGCKDKFFCKVQDVLRNTEIVCQDTVKEKLNGTLRNYNRDKKVNCEVALQGVKNSNEITVPAFFEHVKQCIKRRNWRGHN